MTHLHVYADESGNTGDAVIPDECVAFGGQPVFALAAVAEPAESADSGKLHDALARVRQRHNIHASEIKSRAMKKRPGIVMTLLGELLEHEIAIFVELMDKRFYVANNVVTWFLVGPTILRAGPNQQALANTICDILTDHCAETLKTYARLAQNPTAEGAERFLCAFRTEVARLRWHPFLPVALVDALERLRENATSLYQGRPVPEEMLPPPDVNSGGSCFALLPHVPAFANMYARINRYSDDWAHVTVVHDEQRQYESILQEYAAKLGGNEYREELKGAREEHTRYEFEPGKFELRFADSRATPGIQVADILARYCTQRFLQVLGDGTADAPGDSGAAARTLGALRHRTESVGVNIVSTYERIDRFYNV